MMLPLRFKAGSWARRAILPAMILMLALAGGRVAGQPAQALPVDSESAIATLVSRGSEAGLDPAEITELVTRARTAGYTDEQIARLGQRLVSISEEGLPYEPVLDRMRQGLAKNITFDRVDAVCGGLEQRLRQGAGLVDQAFPEAAAHRARRVDDPVSSQRRNLIDHAGFALEKGVPPASLSAAFADLGTPSAPLAEALHAMDAPVIALTSLVAGGVPAEAGLGFVTSAFRGGVRNRNLEDLGLAVAQEVRESGNQDVLRHVIERLRQGTSPRDLVESLRGNRGRGNHPGPPPTGSRPGLAGRPGRDSNPPVDPGRRGQHRGDGGRTTAGGGGRRP